MSDPPTPASVIFGEAGAGKTRVLTEARARAHDRRIATVVCQRGASLLPLEPLISLVRALQRDGAIAATDRDRVVDAAECDRLAYIREALERAASEPVVFQIDDLHWADAATPDAIRYCIDRLVDLPVTWHLTSRLGSPVIDDFAFGLERAGQAQIINLDSLSLEELRTLAVSVHPGKTIDDVALARLYERTGGNPLYAEMLLATPQADQAEIPRTLRWALHDRLAALSGEAADVAAWIAVHRGSLKQGEVAALSRYSPAQVLASLTELQEKGVLRKTQDGFSFRHELLRDVCYETLDEDIRAARHRELADRSPDEWQRAGHFDGARRYEEAAAILIGIGWDRLDRDAPSESLAAFSRALERLNPDVENAWEARAGLAAATVAVGEIDSAREHMQEFERRAAGLSSRLRVLARSRYAEAAWTGAQDLTSEIPQLESSVAEGIAAAPDLLPRLFCILGSAYERRGDLPAAQVALERGLAYADPDAQQREYIRLRAWLGVVLGRLGRAREGIAMLEEAAERAASLGMANELATCCGKLCYVCNMVADNERYEYWCRRGIDAAGPKSRRTQAGLMINLACVSIDKGRLQEALGLSIAAAANVDPSSSAAVRALHVQAHLFAMLGDAESAQRIVADLYAHTAPAVTKRVDFTAGYCAELRRDLESALSNYERAAAFGSSLDEVDQLEALTGMVRVASALNHRDAAKRALERLRSANRHGWPVLKMLVREAEGFIKLLAGDVTHACEDLLAAAELNQDRFWRAHLRLIVADARADRALFLEVIDEFDALGAATEGDRARSLARTHGLRPGRKREAHGVLSEREISVALLVASGKTNAEIGELLHVSPRTVEYHLTNILGKSGLRSRVEIAIKVAAGTLLGGSSETTTA
ncbi:MAG TPA: LuxR C-terminal-related transcriptional regulator [Candidatus Eremiobacteraceae bacterium]|nr:LuxR C-terminal-related transcriptional regulator [Candidatus Eremiobacteraceae bacterium]